MVIFSTSFIVRWYYLLLSAKTRFMNFHFMVFCFALFFILFVFFLGWRRTWILSYIPLVNNNASVVHFVKTVNSFAFRTMQIQIVRPFHSYVLRFSRCSKTIQTFIRRCVLQYLAYSAGVMKIVTCKRRRSSITINCLATMEWTQFKLSELILSGSLSTYNYVATHCSDANGTKGA